MTDDFKPLTEAENDELAALFNGSRAQQKAPSMDLMSRILADAAKHAPAQEQLQSPAPLRRNLLSGFLSVFGGLPGAAVVAACAVFGLSVGYGASDTLLASPGLTELTSAVGLDFEDQIDYFQTASFDILEFEG